MTQQQKSSRFRRFIRSIGLLAVCMMAANLISDVGAWIQKSAHKQFASNDEALDKMAYQVPDFKVFNGLFISSAQAAEEDMDAPPDAEEEPPAPPSFG